MKYFSNHLCADFLFTFWSPVIPKIVNCPGMVPATVTTAGPTRWTACVTDVSMSVISNVKVWLGLVLLAGKTFCMEVGKLL